MEKKEMTSAALKIKSHIYTQDELAEAFPDVEPGFEPFGSRVIVQLRSPKTKSKGGIILTHDVQETEMWNTQIGKVRAFGPLAFMNRSTQELWPEGKWCEVGDYVRIPKFNQDKWFIEAEDKQILFMLVNDLDLLAKKLGNPLEVKAYI
jgi:co-chaperonin GroES (HSP10)